jgi:hypothetical protein
MRFVKIVLLEEYQSAASDRCLRRRQRTETGQTGELGILRMQVAVIIEQSRTQRRERDQIHGLMCLLDLSRAEHIFENRGKAAQLPKSSYLNFHFQSPSSVTGPRMKACCLPVLSRHVSDGLGS